MHPSNPQPTQAGPADGLSVLARLRRLFGPDGSGAPRRHDDEDDDEDGAAPLARASPARRRNPLRVLVVDDNPVNLMMASAMLAQWAIEPMVAADGAEAVAIASEWPLDLILMDLQMPVLDGLAATRQIRRDERERSRPRVPVVAYTSMPAGSLPLSEVGIDDVLDKPCTVQSLQACLLRWCPRPGQPQATLRPVPMPLR